MSATLYMLEIFMCMLESVQKLKGWTFAIFSKIYSLIKKKQLNSTNKSVGKQRKADEKQKL